MGDVLEKHRVWIRRPDRPQLGAIGQDEGEDRGMRAVYGVSDNRGEVGDADAAVGDDLALESSGGGVWIGGGGGVQFIVFVFFFDDGLLVFVFFIVFFVGSVSFQGVAAEIAGRGFSLLPPVCASVCEKKKRKI